jgi:hypothetical protein
MAMITPQLARRAGLGAETTNDTKLTADNPDDIVLYRMLYGVSDPDAGRLIPGVNNWVVVGGAVAAAIILPMLFRR